MAIRVARHGDGRPADDIPWVKNFATKLGR
jgi:hypothetical protein